MKKHKCSICLFDIDNKFLYTTECHHFFHETCFLQWCKFRKTCPNCRHIVSLTPPKKIVKQLNEFEQFMRVCMNIIRRE